MPGDPRRLGEVRCRHLDADDADGDCCSLPQPLVADPHPQALQQLPVHRLRD